MAHLLQEVARAVGGLGLVRFAKDRVQRLVPVMSRFQVGNAPRNHHLHPLDRVSILRCQRVEVRTDRAHCSDGLQDAVVVHGLDGQANGG